jgi:hypothetical protein
LINTEQGLSRNIEVDGGNLEVDEQAIAPFAALVTNLLDFDVQIQSGVAPLAPDTEFRLDMLSLFMTAAILAEFWQLGAAGADLLIPDSTTFSTVASILVVCANAYIWDNMIRRSTRYTVDYIRGASPPSLTKQWMPRFYTGFTGMGTIASAFTFVPQMLFAKTFFPRWAFYPIGILASLGTYFGGVAATHAVRDMIIRGISKNRNNQILDVDSRFEKLSGIIGKASPEAIGEFILNLPDSLVARLKAPSKDVVRRVLENMQSGDKLE